MELKDFVRETILQIIAGVREAQSDIPGVKGSIVVPKNTRSDGNDRFISPTGGLRYVTDVEIDVAVTAEEKEGSKVGIGVFASVVGIGAGTKSEETASRVSKIKFIIPIALPTGSE